MRTSVILMRTPASDEPWCTSSACLKCRPSATAFWSITECGPTDDVMWMSRRSALPGPTLCVSPLQLNETTGSLPMPGISTWDACCSASFGTGLAGAGLVCGCRASSALTALLPAACCSASTSSAGARRRRRGGASSRRGRETASCGPARRIARRPYTPRVATATLGPIARRGGCQGVDHFAIALGYCRQVLSTAGSRQGDGVGSLRSAASYVIPRATRADSVLARFAGHPLGSVSAALGYTTSRLAQESSAGVADALLHRVRFGLLAMLAALRLCLRRVACPLALGLLLLAPLLEPTGRSLLSFGHHTTSHRRRYATTLRRSTRFRQPFVRPS